MTLESWVLNRSLLPQTGVHTLLEHMMSVNPDSGIRLVKSSGKQVTVKLTGTLNGNVVNSSIRGEVIQR